MTTHNARVILPSEATGIMKEKGSTWVDGSLDRTHEAYRAMLSASPNSGRVTAEMLEAAARAAYRSHIDDPSCPLRSADRARLREIWTDEIRKYWMTRVRAAFKAIGLTVEE